MLPADLPDRDRLLSLAAHEDEASVSISLESSPVPQDHERVRVALRNAIDEAEERLDRLAPGHGGQEVVEGLRAVLTDREFWEHQARSLILLAAPGRQESFRIPSRVRDRVVVGRRFDLSGLIRALSFPVHAFVLQLSQSGTRLTEIGVPEGTVTHELSLPDDHELMLERTGTDGTFDRRRARGATGDRLPHERFSRAVQQEVIRIVPSDVPLILAASDDFDPAYRAVNTHPLLMDETIAPHPDSLDQGRLEQAALEVLDRRRAAEVDAWRERFGTLRSEGLATTRLREVAAAAAADAIDELRVDMDAELFGRIDEFGTVEVGDEADEGAEDILAHLIAQVLDGGGTVLAIRREESLDGSPAAAILRFRVPAPG